MNIVTLEFKKCCICGNRATAVELLQECDESGSIDGTEYKKHFCAEHTPNPLDEDGLRFLVDARDKEIEKLKASIDWLLACGNHIATYHTDRWPDYALDGLTRNQQCEHALRKLGATQEYDMWCCWSGMMQARDIING